MNLSKNNSYPYYYLSMVEEVSRQIRDQQSQQLDQVINLLFKAWQNDRWVYIMGNGGSASTATHLAADLGKTICSSPADKGLKAIALFDNPPMVSAYINDWGWDDLFVNQLKTYFVDGALGIGLSVHGGSGQDQAGAWSQNLLKGLQYIKDRGGQTIGLSGFDGGAMKDLVDVSIVVPADSTPLVESFHVVLHHLIVFGLVAKIDVYKKTGFINKGR